MKLDIKCDKDGELAVPSALELVRWPTPGLIKRTPQAISGIFPLSYNIEGAI